MKEELRSELRSLRSLQDGHEDRGQLLTLLPQQCELLRVDNSRFHEQFQPVSAFLDLAQRIATLRNKFHFAPRAKRFAIVSADGSSGSEQLLAKHLRLCCLRKRGKHAHNPNREGPSSDRADLLESPTVCFRNPLGESPAVASPHAPHRRCDFHEQPSGASPGAHDSNWGWI